LALRPPFVAVLPAALLTICVACTPVPSPAEEARERLAAVEEFTAAPADIAVPRQALAPESALARLARRAATESLRQSSAIFALQEARNDVLAVQSRWYPQVRPVAAADTSGDVSIGIAVEQRIWDFGRVRADLDRARNAVTIARVNLWVERNEAVFEALDAYLDAQGSLGRLGDLNALQEELSDLRTAIEGRASGGVAGRGEVLDIDIAQNRAQREILTERSNLAVARDRVRQAIGATGDFDLPRLGDADTAGCSVQGGDAAEPPELALARLDVVAAGLQRNAVRARQFPVIVGAADVTTSRDDSDPVGTLRIGASDLLGWDRRARLEAADQAAFAAAQNHANTQRTVGQDLDALLADLDRQRESLTALTLLAASSADSQSVFWALFDSGQVSLTEGIRLTEEASRSRRAVLDAKVDLVRTCVRLARIEGALTEADLDRE